MKIRYELTSADIDVAVKEVRQGGFSRTWLSWWLIVLVPAWIIGFGLALFGYWYSLLFFVHLVAIAIVVFWGQSYETVTSTVRRLASAPITMELSPSALNIDSRFGKLRMDWSQVARVSEVDNRILLEIKDGSCHVVPARVFETESERERFLEVLKTCRETPQNFATESFQNNLPHEGRKIQLATPGEYQRLQAHINRSNQPPFKWWKLWPIALIVIGSVIIVNTPLSKMMDRWTAGIPPEWITQGIFLNTLSVLVYLAMVSYGKSLRRKFQFKGEPNIAEDFRSWFGFTEDWVIQFADHFEFQMPWCHMDSVGIEKGFVVLKSEELRETLLFSVDQFEQPDSANTFLEWVSLKLEKQK